MNPVTFIELAQNQDFTAEHAIWLNNLTQLCHGVAAESGWWVHRQTGCDLKQLINHPEDSFQHMMGGALVAMKLCLTHSEISEAMEGHRKNLKDDKLPHRSMLEVELADAMIRIMDLAGALGLDLGGALVEKLEFNTQRPDHKPENREATNGKAY